MNKGDETRLRNLTEKKQAGEKLSKIEANHLKRLELKKKSDVRAPQPA